MAETEYEKAWQAVGQYVRDWNAARRDEDCPHCQGKCQGHHAKACISHPWNCGCCNKVG